MYTGLRESVSASHMQGLLDGSISAAGLKWTRFAAEGNEGLTNETLGFGAEPGVPLQQ